MPDLPVLFSIVARYGRRSLPVNLGHFSGNAVGGLTRVTRLVISSCLTIDRKDRQNGAR